MLHIISEDILNLGDHSFIKIIVKLHLHAFHQTFVNGKTEQNLVPIYKTFNNLLLQSALGYVQLNFVQMVVPPTLLAK